MIRTPGGAVWDAYGEFVSRRLGRSPNRLAVRAEQTWVGAGEVLMWATGILFASLPIADVAIPIIAAT